MRAKLVLLLGGSVIVGAAALWLARDLGAAPAQASHEPSPSAPVDEDRGTQPVHTPHLANTTARAVRAISSHDTAQDPVTRDNEVLAKIDANLADRLRGERVDAGWANETESAIVNAVADPGFAGLRLEAVHCGSTICRVAIAAGNEVDDVAALVEELTSAQPFRSGGFLRFTGDRAVTMFVARAGTQLPPPPRS